MISDTKPEKTSKSICLICLMYIQRCIYIYFKCVGLAIYGVDKFGFSSIFRFIVRDFQYNEEEMKADKEEMTRLSTDKKKQFVRVLP